MGWSSGTGRLHRPTWGCTLPSPLAQGSFCTYICFMLTATSSTTEPSQSCSNTHGAISCPAEAPCCNTESLPYPWGRTGTKQMGPRIYLKTSSPPPPFLSKVHHYCCQNSQSHDVAVPFHNHFDLPDYGKSTPSLKCPAKQRNNEKLRASPSRIQRDLSSHRRV